ncbi:hypothetical protein B0I35DRAFT_481796 [Stachybotrys elegans]|uniref:Uncharacterized protein n=1 Tax=Stachybotrys elegans TaxID=80388 RepID=A0A8K0SEY6_9HYPO|nr:hypothetical protein B0I35DRAFT_481796 [Stachybotrys elegans]
MPLFVPGVMSEPNSKAEQWQNKLVGKTLSDSESNENCFCKRDLPQGTRIVEPGMLLTMDHVPDRLNVHVTEDGIVSHVVHG